MKIRNGFVSNSSSSSFIISDKHFPNIKELAIYMLNRQKEDDLEGSYYETKKWKNDYLESFKKQISILNRLDVNQPISFSSCNYDTYIRKVGDMYLVSTCNNTNWELYEYCNVVLSDVTKDELLKLSKNYINNSNNNSDENDYNTIMGLINGEDLHEFYHFGNDFYDISHEIMGTETFDQCKKCGSYLWDTPKHGKLCLKCDYPIYKRKEKLEEIKKLNDSK